MQRIVLGAVFMFLIFGSGGLMAQEESDTAATESEPMKLEKMKVTSLEETLRRKGMLKDVIEKTEIITPEDIEVKQAASLFEAVKDEPGVTVNTECSMCGIKRIMINGLKGEHTTVLVDGVPMHSVVSSYYGMDALATAGVSRIEVARGAGPSLLSPEAIGGSINIIFDKPTRTGATGDISFGENGYRKYSFVGTAVSSDDRIALLGIAQYDNIDQEDADDNKVNETPDLENYTFSLKGFYDMTDSDQFQFRATKIRSDVHGGYMSENYEAVRQDPGDPAFVGGNVNNRYIGAKLGTSEYILTEREEFSGKWLHQLSDPLNFSISMAYAKHSQDSVYEGFDYDNEVPSYYGNAKVNYLMGNHLFTGGISGRYEELRADSVEVDSNPELVSDDYDYSDYGIFIQDSWQIIPGMELTVALRVDKIQVDWKDQIEEDDEIDETILAPRLHFRWAHTPSLTSRVSFGRGYRAPLTFFESDHGILEEGFNVNITDLEKSWGGGYTISYADEKWAASCGINYTQVENLATIDTDNYARPTLVNSDEKGEVTAFDIQGSYKVTEWLSIGAGYENFFMSDEYKKTFGIAPIEQRVSLSLDVAKSGWMFTTNAYWVGSRDLEDYGYEGYNTYNEATGEVSGLKTIDAPDYWQIDMRLAKELGQYLSFYAGVKNLLDYTQAGDEDSPLFYDAEGGYDVGYIYGPLRGRTAYAGLKVTF